MSLILSIETTTTNCSVALSKNGETFALKEDYNNNYSHGERLHVYIKTLLDSKNILAKDLDAVAISKGPGSYTGLRIGVSAAKGLCYALNKPLISISTLEALAHQVTINNGIIIPMLDARRMEVYAAVFNSKYSVLRDVNAEVLTKDSYKNYLEQQAVYFIGNGVEKTKTLIQHTNANFIDGKLPSAATMGQLAYTKFKNNCIEDVAYFEPYYLKDFKAIPSKK